MIRAYCAPPPIREFSPIFFFVFYFDSSLIRAFINLVNIDNLKTLSFETNLEKFEMGEKY